MSPFRSNDVYLILLPRPWSLCKALCKLIVSLHLLLLSGDVKLRLYPRRCNRTVKTNCRGHSRNKGRKLLNTRLNATDKKLKKITSIEKHVSECNKQISHLEKHLMAMERKVEDLENRTHRSNLVICSVKEQHNK